MPSRIFGQSPINWRNRLALTFVVARGSDFDVGWPQSNDANYRITGAWQPPRFGINSRLRPKQVGPDVSCIRVCSEREKHLKEELNRSSNEKIEHLKLLQDVITRMALESRQIKQYALASVAAIMSVSAAVHSWWLPLTGAALVIVYWALDGRYLQQERWFRDLYTIAVKSEVADFEMNPSETIRRTHTHSGSMFSWSTLWLYVSLIAILVAISFVASMPS
jgi:hypothetical protein